jgi:hypothetical protein
VGIAGCGDTRLGRLVVAAPARAWFFSVIASTYWAASAIRSPDRFVETPVIERRASSAGAEYFL